MCYTPIYTHNYHLRHFPSISHNSKSSVFLNQLNLSEREGFKCVVKMDCFLNVAKALGIDSCLSLDDWEDLPLAPATSGVIASRKRKKQASRSLGVDMLLQKIPGRMFLNGSSDVASLFSKQGTKGVKQDAMLVWENFGISSDTIFCGVFDGHGQYGHLVAKNVRDSLPIKLRAQWELIRSSKDGLNDVGGNAVGNLNSEDTALLHVDKELKTDSNCQLKETTDDDILRKLKESFLKAFKVVDKELKHHPSIDCFCSGTTALTLLKEGQYLIIGNVGDSRAVLGTRGKGNYLKAVQLTVDMKPNLPKEAERIRRCKGRVFALPNEPNVVRIWLPNSDTPGLAMARALGDFCLKDFGLISVPEISYHRITEQDEFVVLASDGVWDVLTNKQVVDIVSSVPRSNAARSVVESAVRTWKSRRPLAKIDDCAVVCLFLNSKSDGKLNSLVASEQTLTSYGQAPLKNISTEDVHSLVDALHSYIQTEQQY